MRVSFGEKLKELRKEHGLTQEELSKNIHVSISTVGMYERGERFPAENNLKNLADFFNVSMDCLLGRTNQSTYAGVSNERTEDPFDVFDQGSTKDQFYYKVYDDSMEMGYLPEGSLALIKRQSHIDSQDIAVVELNGEILLRRFIKKNNVTVLEPESYNPKHKLKIVTDGEDTLSIVGKVISAKINFG